MDTDYRSKLITDQVEIVYLYQKKVKISSHHPVGEQGKCCTVQVKNDKYLTSSFEQSIRETIRGTHSRGDLRDSDENKP